MEESEAPRLDDKDKAQITEEKDNAPVTNPTKEEEEGPTEEELKEAAQETEDLKKGRSSKYKELCKQMIIPHEAAKKVKVKPDGTAEEVEKWHIDAEAVKNRTPLLVFINRKSGGQQGTELITKLTELLHPCQVFDLANGGPAPGLEAFKHVHNARIWVAGGDGTAGWVLSTIDKLELNPAPPVAVLPLGTGNDLARSLRWGGGYKGEKIVPIVQHVGEAKEVSLDRWSLKIGAQTSEGTFDELKQVNVMNNYFSIGVDAGIALEFHEKREAHPEKFSSRTLNKLNYGAIGGKAFFHHKALHKSVEIELDGQKVEFPHDIEGIAVLNLNSYMGGTNLWGTKASTKHKPQACDDGLFEVVGVNGSFHLGAIKARLSSAKRLGQGKEIKITIKSAIPVQIDGEPWMQDPAQIQISHLNKVRMLCRLKSAEKKSLAQSNSKSH